LFHLAYSHIHKFSRNLITFAATSGNLLALNAPEMCLQSGSNQWCADHSALQPPSCNQRTTML